MLQPVVQMIREGGWTLFPLLLFSVIAWVIIFERALFLRKVSQGISHFQWEVQALLLRSEWDRAYRLCESEREIPTALALLSGFERLRSKDSRLREGWRSAVERSRQQSVQALKGPLWMLGTIGSASPFVGLFGTVVGILGSFREMSVKGAGGFTVVAGGISEALVATAAGILVAVISVVAYNAFQTRLNGLFLKIRIQLEELTELMQVFESEVLAVESSSVSSKVSDGPQNT